MIGAVQGLALPFRGFSRSGSTISAGLLLGIVRACAEEFSFALAVIITPVVIAREVWMLIKEHAAAATASAGPALESTPPASANFYCPACWEWCSASGRNGGAVVAVRMAGARPLEIFRLLLPAGRRNCPVAAFHDVILEQSS